VQQEARQDDILTTSYSEVKMPAVVQKKTPKPLDEYRLERYQDVTEFITDLGVSAHTYYAAIDPKKSVRPSTMRRIAAALGVHPSEIAEFARRAPTDV
jgi:DNA-binding Xre family transcriptional regulator